MRRIIYMAAFILVAALLWFSGQQSSTELPLPVTPSETATEPVELGLELLPPDEHQASFSQGPLPTPETTPEAVPEPAAEPVANAAEDQPPPAAENAPAADNLCTLSVRCDAAWDEGNSVAADIMAYQPADGVIFYSAAVTLEPNDTAFTVLQRELRAADIPLEFAHTPAYNSIYIEGINHLYEMDGGALSGWIYKVNGSSPGRASSGYHLRPGDTLEFLYTCDLGRDLGINIDVF